MGVLSKSDGEFVRKAMKQMGIQRVDVAYERTTGKWPDIWIRGGRVPVITVTPEWRRQHFHERRKRLVHELLHLKGMEHGEYQLGSKVYEYNTHPDQDTLSQEVYEKLK